MNWWPLSSSPTIDHDAQASAAEQIRAEFPNVMKSQEWIIGSDGKWGIYRPDVYEWRDPWEGYAR